MTRSNDADVPPRISVVIPAYNAAAFLPEAVASVRAQTLPPIELLVIDDKSTDDTRRLARTFEDVTLIECDVNGGAATARNLGIAAARGEWIAFLDADDRWHPRHLEIVLAAIRSSGSTLGWTQSRIASVFPPVDPHPRLHVRAGAELLVDMLGTNPVAQTTAVVRRDILIAAGAYQAGERYAEDYELFLRLAPTGTFVQVFTTTCLYRLHEGQTSRAGVEMLRHAWRHRLAAFERWRSLALTAEPTVQQQLLDSIHRAFDADVGVAWYDAARDCRDELERIAMTSPFLDGRWQPLMARLEPWAFARLRAVIRPLVHRLASLRT